MGHPTVNYKSVTTCFWFYEISGHGGQRWIRFDSDHLMHFNPDPWKNKTGFRPVS